VLPAPPRTALVLGLPEVAAALRRAGVVVSDRARPQATTEGLAPAPDPGSGERGAGPTALDVAIAAPAHLDSAVAADPTSIAITGLTGHAATRRLARAGYSATRLLVRRGPNGPRRFVPVHGPPPRHALLRWWRPPGRLRALRNEAIAALVGIGLPLPRTMLTIATRTPGPPWPVGSAAGLGVPADAAWIFSPSTGDELQRATFHLFPPGRTAPAWVLKLSRVPGNDEPFAADEQGLLLATRAGPLTAQHTPRLLGRLDLAGLPASLESAAPGRPLNEYLAASGHRRAKLTAVGAVARWIVEVGAETAEPPGTLDGERRRLVAVDPGAAPLLSALPPVPGVLAHHDLGTWNIAVSNGAQFTVIDWESARRPAMPLWDLLYFLTDALVALDGPTAPEVQVRRAIALHRGEHQASHVLFEWVCRYADRLSLAPAAIALLATLCWRHHALSSTDRTASLVAMAEGAPSAELGLLARMAGPWQSDPTLGSAWSAWRD